MRDDRAPGRRAVVVSIWARKAARRHWSGSADLGHVLRGRAFLSLHNVELDLVTLGQRPEAAGLDGRMMDEAILLPALWRDEPEPLRVVEPLDRALGTHCRTPSVLLD